EDERPFCLVSSFIHPHDPYATRQKYWDLYSDRDISPPTVQRRTAAETDSHNKRLEKVIALDAVDVSTDEIIAARRAYYGNVSYVDEWVGRIRSTLEECDLARNTTIVFLSDHGDMLGEHGLWYKMSFREWSCRIPMIIHNPSQFAPGVVEHPVAQIDVLPTLLDLASGGETSDIPEAIDPLHGMSLVPMCSGSEPVARPRVLSEYLAEGTGEPMLMVRNARFKYIQCASDPDQLFDLQDDPDELVNLADSESHTSVLTDLKSVADAHWDSDQIRDKVIRDQKRRRAVSAALRVGRYQGWDYDPRRNPAEEYTRSHLDLTRFDISSRYPRPKPFKPDWS
ncbi:MAG: sulfatase-like hydrolase/transferase, partial [Granulosicoccus sp.]|nr:sulfatase-like hydrolase/transferase [Granulosicoccus sp.]